MPRRLRGWRALHGADKESQMGPSDHTGCCWGGGAWRHRVGDEPHDIARPIGDPVAYAETTDNHR